MKKLPHIGVTAFLGIVMVLSLCVNIGVYAATTGKIQGTITDSQSNEPMPGVNVIVEGTVLGAATDENGFFFIINVPPGTYRLKASMVGYATETKNEVRVYVDRTTTTNFSLKTQAVAGEEVTVTAERVPVPLDVSATEAYLSGEDVAESAEGRFDELMGLQAGVEMSSDAQRGEGFSVRGGGIDETDLQVDGMSMKNEMSRVDNISLSRNLIKDVQILTGGFNAEYGNIRSGLINIITKDGSYNRYSGVLEGIYSPAATKHFGDFGPYDARDRYNGLVMGGTGWDDIGISGMNSDAVNGYGDEKVYNHDVYVLAYEEGEGQKYLDEHPYFQSFVGWTNIGNNNGYSASTAADIYRWIHRPIEYGGNPDLTLDVGVGGPVPGIPRTKFYTSHYWNKSMYAFPTAREFSTEFTGTGKITHRIKSNMTLTANFMYNYVAALGTDELNQNISLGSVVADRTENNQIYGGWYSNKYYAESMTLPKFNRNYFGNIKFTHTYSPKTYWDLEIGVQRGFIKAEHIRDRNITKLKFIDDPVKAAAGWQDYNMETGESYGYPAGRIGLDEMPRGFYLFQGENTSSRNSNSIIGTDDQLGNRVSQIQYKWTHSNNTTINIKANIVSQVTKYNQIKAGFDFSNFHVNHRSFRSGDLGTGYINIEQNAPRAFQVYTVNPRQYDAYIQDKLEWEGMIVNFGLRATYWDPNTNGFDVTENNMFQTIWSPAEQWGNVIGEGNWKFRNQRTRKIKGKILLQPRVGISHPITESSKIFFNYGHFYQRPELWDMFLVSGNLYAGLMTQAHIPVPDLPWPKTVSYEIGYSQSIYDQVLLQISGYYKDYTNEESYLNMLSYYQNVDYVTHTANRYRDVRGLEFRVERSFGRFFNFWANYNYMIQSSGNTGFRSLFENQLRQDEQYFWFGQARINPRPSFRISITLRTPVGFGPGPSILGIKPFAEWRLNWLTNWRDGGEFVYNVNAAPKDWKYVQRINYKMHDFYLTKRIARGASIYLRVKNILNIKYLDPGSGYRDSLRFPWTDPKGDDKYGDYDKYHINTFTAGNDYEKWRRNKRDFYFGIRYQF